MEPQSSVSLLQLGGLMAGLVIVAFVFLGAALWITRRRSQTTPKPAAKKQPQPTTKRPAQRPRPSQERQRQQARPQNRRMESPSTNAPAPNAPPGATELMRVYRDPANGELIIQIEGEDYRTLGDIKQAGIEKPFLAVLRDLARTAKETGDQVTRQMPARPAHPVEPTPEPAPARAPLTAVPPTIEELTGSTMQTQEPEPIGTFFGNMRKMVPGGPSNEELEQPLGIADQIEAVLQLKLLNSEAFQGHRLHIKPAPGGGVRIEVGDKIYEAVSDIENVGIREFVQSAIQDWERQQG